MLFYSDPWKDNPYGKLKGDMTQVWAGLVFDNGKLYHHEDTYILAANFTSKELRRRLIVIPFKKADVDVLDIDNLDWSSFSQKFNEFWSYEQAEILLTIRSSLNRIKGLTAQQKAICLDLIAVGVSAGIWSDENVAVQELKDCFDWLKEDVKIEQLPLVSLIQELLKETENNCKQVNTIPCIYTHQLRNIVDAWYAKGYLFDKAPSKDITKVMQELGYRSNGKGQWLKKL